MKEIKPGDLVNVINQDGEFDGPFLFLEGPIKPENSSWHIEHEELAYLGLSFKNSLWYYLVMNNDSPKWLERGFNTLIKLENLDAKKS
jgi:hypothetical protein